MNRNHPFHDLLKPFGIRIDLHGKPVHDPTYQIINPFHILFFLSHLISCSHCFFFTGLQELVEIVMPGIQPDGLIDQYRILPKIPLQFLQGVHACLVVVQKGMYQPVPGKELSGPAGHGRGVQDAEIHWRQSGMFPGIYNPQNDFSNFPKRNRKVRPEKPQNEKGRFHSTHTKIEQRLNTFKSVFKRCFFIAKNTQKAIVNSTKMPIFTL